MGKTSKLVHGNAIDVPTRIFHIFCTFANMKRNILALYLIKLSKWFTLVMPIIVLFYEKHGLGLQDVFILKSVYSIAAVALEIPFRLSG